MTERAHIFQNSHIWPVLLLLGLSLLSVQPLFHEGLYSAHDIWHQVARLYHYSAAICDGALLPNWITTLARGYGYPLFYFSYHLPWLFSLPFLWMGFSVFTTLKIVTGLAFFAAGLSMYALTSTLFKNKYAAFTASALYLISPYHYLTVYVSASIGTLFQFALIPLIILGLFQVIVQQKRLGIVVLSLSVAGSILAHFMTFVFLVPFFVLGTLFLLIISTKRFSNLLRTLLMLVISAVLSLGVCAFYLIPTFVYLPLVRAGDFAANFSALYKGGFVTIQQLLYSAWGFAPISSSAAEADISFQVGIAQWLVLIGSLGVLLAYAVYHLILTKAKKASIVSKLLSLLRNTLDEAFLKSFWVSGLFLLSLFALSIWLMIDSSQLLWDFVAKFFTLDFPFRYIIVSVTIASLLASFFICSLKNTKLQLLFTVLLLAAAVYTNRNHVRVNMYTEYTVQEYVAAELTTNTFHEYLPKDADAGLIQPDFPPLIDGLDADLLYESATRLVVGVKVLENREVAIRQFDFPGQQVYLNGQKIQREIKPGKLITLQVTPGYQIIEVVYENPPLYTFGMIISIVSLGILVGIFVYRKQ